MHEAPRNNQTGDRREDILAAAEMVFDARGYGATRVEEVAAKAGVSKGSVYNYFQSKQDLFEQVFFEAIGREEQAAMAVLTGPQRAIDKLQQYVSLWGQRLGQQKRIGALLLEFWATAARDAQGDGLGSRLGELHKRWCSILTDVIRQGMDEGDLKVVISPEVAACMLIAVLDGLTMHVVMSTGPSVDTVFVEELQRGVAGALAGAEFVWAADDKGHQEDKGSRDD